MWSTVYGAQCPNLHIDNSKEILQGELLTLHISVVTIVVYRHSKTLLPPKAISNHAMLISRKTFPVDMPRSHRIELELGWLNIRPILIQSLYISRIINPSTSGNAWVHNQHCGYSCPGAKAPRHQYPQCWLRIYCVGAGSNKYITFAANNIWNWN